MNGALSDDMIQDRFEEDEAAAVSEFHDMFLDGNELIEDAIKRYHADASEENLNAVLETVRQRMHADGHFIFPVQYDEEDENRFAFLSVRTDDGKFWTAAFTSQAEFRKGEPSRVLSHFIDSCMKQCLDFSTEGFIINPWGRSFFLSKEMMKMIFKADGGVEYSVPDDQITAELLEDGSFLKRAVEICCRNRTQLNLIKLARILRDSPVWVPCKAIMSDEDYDRIEKMVMEAQEKGDLNSTVGQEITVHDNVRLVPDILQKGSEFFFPVFTTEEEMGEYGESFSKVRAHFLETVNLAKNNEKNVVGIVINAFSDQFIIPREMFDIIAGMDCNLQ